MIDWIHDKLKAWGRAKWRIINKSDGYPESIFGRIMEYGPGAGDHTRLEYFREGMTGDALEASLAIFRAMHAHILTDRQYEVVFVHYAVLNKPIAEKREAIGYKDHKSYYECLHRAHKNIELFFEESPQNGGGSVG